MSDAVVGKEVDGYRIQAVLGRGGMGTVYKAEDVNLSRPVAIKRINPSQADRESFIHRFRSEAQALARVDSPYIVGVYALRDTDIGLLIVMEFVEGGTLKDPLDSQGVIAPGQAIPILEQILRAFHDAHTAGVIHRDIKPQNILLTEGGIVKVTDFGIAKLRQPDSGETVTQGGQGGTLKYMSPEQISNISEVDARSDLYSIGMTAYEMFAGSLPFTETDTDFDIMRKVVEGTIPPPDEYNSDIPSGLAQWVMGAVKKDQAARYQSAEEMLDALREADRQADVTVTQPEWEVDDGSADVDQTQTMGPGPEDRTKTVVPDGADDAREGVSSGGQTVVDPQVGSGGGGPPETGGQSPVSEGTGDDGDDEIDEHPNWSAILTGVGALLLLVVGGYFAVAQLGGGVASGATLALTSSPEGATVLVNGDTAGTTPLQNYALTAGPVDVTVRKAGYESIDTSFTIETDQHVELQGVTLPGAGAVDEADGTLAADAGGPSANSEGDPGASGNTSGASNGPDASQTESGQSGSESGREGTDETTSEPSVGTVEVTSEPVGTVLVDGEEQSGPGGITLPTGEHTISCRHPEYDRTADTTIVVSAGQTETLACYTEWEVNVNTDGPWGRVWLNRTDTGTNTDEGGALSLPPGTHRIEVRRLSLDDFTVAGGRVKITRGEEGRIENFTGDSYVIDVRPSFTNVEYAVVFEISDQ